MKKIICMIAAAVLAAACAPASAKTLYGLTSTSWEENNGRLVSIDTDELSDNPQAPSRFKELATVEYANDIMAGTSVGDKYFLYYNTYNGETGESYQYFGNLDFNTGAFTPIAVQNHVDSDDVTDMMDITYDPANGGLLGLDRQYIPSETKFVSTIQNISMTRGKLTEVYCFDRKYVAICSDGEGGFYLATLERDDSNVYHPALYKANSRFEVTPLVAENPQIVGESSFAHSMALDGNMVYLVCGKVMTVYDLESLEAVNYYLERDLFGITFSYANQGSGVTMTPASDCKTTYYDLCGRIVNEPVKGGLYIRIRDGRHDKIIF